MPTQDHAVWFISAVSGLRYANPGAAGDIAQVIVQYDDMRRDEYYVPAAELAAAQQETKDVRDAMAIISDVAHSNSEKCTVCKWIDRESQARLEAVEGTIEDREQQQSDLREENDRLREAIATLKCRTVYQGYPDGFTCLDVVEHARNPETRYGEEFREQILKLEHLCENCRVKSAAL